MISDLIERGIDREAGMDPGVSWVIPALAEIPDPDFPGIELLAVRPRTKSAPVIERP